MPAYRHPNEYKTLEVIKLFVFSLQWCSICSTELCTAMPLHFLVAPDSEPNRKIWKGNGNWGVRHTTTLINPVILRLLPASKISRESGAGDNLETSFRLAALIYLGDIRVDLIAYHVMAIISLKDSWRFIARIKWMGAISRNETLGLDHYSNQGIRLWPNAAWWLD